MNAPTLPHVDFNEIINRTIVGALRICDDDANWDEHDEYILCLDDGSCLSAQGWGYDAWGAILGRPDSRYRQIQEAVGDTTAYEALPSA